MMLVTELSTAFVDKEFINSGAIICSLQQKFHIELSLFFEVIDRVIRRLDHSTFDDRGKVCARAP